MLQGTFGAGGSNGRRATSRGGPGRSNGCQRAHELFTARRRIAFGERGPQHASQAGAAEIRHADGAETCSFVLMDRIDRHDMRVLQLGQRLRLIRVRGRDLEHNRAPGQIGLLGEKNAGERSTAQLSTQAKAE